MNWLVEKVTIQQTEGKKANTIYNDDCGRENSNNNILLPMQASSVQFGFCWCACV